MTGKNRPYIICHMLSSIDGRISGDFFRLSELQPARFAFGRIRSEFDCDGILYGTVTAAVFDRSPYCSENIPAAFSLLDVQKLDEDTLWLRYRPKNIRGK